MTNNFNFTPSDITWMQHAIQLAKTAAQHEEVPVGAVLVLNNEIISEGWNRPIGYCDPSAHAEILAVREGAKKINNYRILDTTLYVTLEPCIMCLGALVHARVKRVVFGAYDMKSGAVTSVFKMSEAHQLNHKIQFEGGLLQEECGKLLSDFFKERRRS